MRTLPLLRLLGVCAILALVGGPAAPADALPPLPGEREFPAEAKGPPSGDDFPADPSGPPTRPEIPVQLERLEGDEVRLTFFHPRADELGFDRPFLQMDLGPAHSPRSMRFSSPAAVPEPSTGLLLALGVGGLALRRSRRR